jgi:hypothetical protein
MVDSRFIAMISTLGHQGLGRRYPTIGIQPTLCCAHNHVTPIRYHINNDNTDSDKIRNPQHSEEYVDVSKVQ